MHFNSSYWDQLAEAYQRETLISLDDFHYGPLVPGDSVLNLLPDVNGRHCLELGCGAGQNSIVLAKNGARCTALDYSSAQLEHGRQLAGQIGVDVDFQQKDLDADWSAGWHDAFDLVHSVYSLPFCQHPETVLRQTGQVLKDNGRLILSVGHPLYAGEWVECEGRSGSWIDDYFHLPDDVREMDGASVQSRTFTFDELSRWLSAAGFLIEEIREPAAQTSGAPPYTSSDWKTLRDVLSCIPIVAVFRCLREE